jgi:hypothetical protein
MDILMIYWKSVWAHSHRDASRVLARHSSAEMDAYERRLHSSTLAAAPARRAHVVRLDGTPWTPGAAESDETRH